MKTVLLTLTATVSLSLGVQALPVSYLRSNTGVPWGVSTNEQAMDAAFGAGQWSDLRYESTNAASLFSSSTRFVFLEGSDSNANELETFLDQSWDEIVPWVQNGGSLFINSAPNEGDGMIWAGGLGYELHYWGGSSNVHAVNAAHAIFQGLATIYTGSSFSHAYVTGPGISLIEDEFGRAVLTEQFLGSGLVLCGGMTTTNFHAPQPDALLLRENILSYAYSHSSVPEVGTGLMLGFVFFAFAAGGRNKRAVTAV